MIEMSNSAGLDAVVTRSAVADYPGVARAVKTCASVKIIAVDSDHGRELFRSLVSRPSVTIPTQAPWLKDSRFA